MTVSYDGDYYKAVHDLHDMVGKAISGDNKSIIYTGYEWRGPGILNGTETRKIYALSEDGHQMTGRWYVAAHYDTGGEFQAVPWKVQNRKFL